MGRATLTIDLDALVSNWRAIDRLSGPGAETAAVVKADGYGLGAGAVARALAAAGARRFFVAQAREGASLRAALGPGVDVLVLEGHMPAETATIAGASLIPTINSPEQWRRHRDTLPGRPFGVQLDTGMNRLGLEPCEWAALRDPILAAGPEVVMSHLACADEPGHPANCSQLAAFRSMTEGVRAPRSLAATGGVLLGPTYHFDLTRPGIGLYGGLPFAAASPVVSLDLPVIQTRDVAPGEGVGYGLAWRALGPSRIATLSAGYADGLIRAMGGLATVWADGVPCPVVGRVSMDLLTVDVTDVDPVPTAMEILGPHQGVDALAEAAGTIGYEVLTSLGTRYDRRHLGPALMERPQPGRRSA